MLAAAISIAVLVAWVLLLRQARPPEPLPATPTIRVIVVSPEATMTPLPTATVEPTRPELIVVTATTRQPTVTPSPTSTPAPTDTPTPAARPPIQRGDLDAVREL